MVATSGVCGPTRVTPVKWLDLFRQPRSFQALPPEVQNLVATLRR